MRNSISRAVTLTTLILNGIIHLTYCWSVKTLGMKLNNFSTYEPTKFACTLSEKILTNIEELELTKLDKATIAAILQIMPVMFLNLGQTSVFINMQEFVYVPNYIEAFLAWI